MDLKVRERAVQAVSDIFRAAGYTVNKADPPLSLSAFLGTDIILILCSDDPDEIELFSKQEYSVLIHETETNCIKLVITFSSSIEAPGCIVWYPDDFARYAGQAVLSGVLKRKLAIHSDNLSLETWYRTDEADISIQNDERRIAHLPIRVSLEDISTRADENSSITLLFVPYWFYRYRCKGKEVFQERTVVFDRSDEGACSAMTGRFIDIDAGAIVRRDIPSDATVITPAIRKEDAVLRITEYLLQALSEDIRIKNVKGETITYEEKLLSPSRESISLDVKGVYLPVWQIKGKRVREIDAFTGEYVAEPIDDGVEVF